MRKILPVLAIVLLVSFFGCGGRPHARPSAPPRFVPPIGWQMTNASWGGLGSGNFANNSQLAGGVGGRTFIDNVVSDSMLQAGTITAVSYLCNDATAALGMKFKVFRANGANYDLVGESEKFTPVSGSAQTRTLSTPITGVHVGDRLGIWLGIDGGAGSDTVLAVATGGGTGAIKWSAGDVTGANRAFGNSIDAFTVCLEAFGAQPTAACTGDSIEVGHGGTFTSYFDGTGPLLGADGSPACELGFNMASQISNWSYQDFAEGGQQFSWVLSTGLPAILSRTGMHGSVACGATELWIHCGVNDLFAGRSNSAMLADLDSIRTLWGTTLPIFLDEVLPDSNFTDLQAAAIRSWNTALAGWALGKPNVRVVSCWDAFGQVRVSTGLKDDLKSSFDSGDHVHINATGAAALATLRAAARAAYFFVGDTVVGSRSWSNLAASGVATLQRPVGQVGAGRLYGAVASDQTFRLDVYITYDGGTSWALYKSVASSAGSDATYVKSAEMDLYVPSLCRVDVVNTSGSTSIGVYDIRPFNRNQH